MIVYIVGLIIIIIFAFLIKNYSKKDTSITRQLIDVLKREYPLILFCLAIYLIHCYNITILNSKTVESNTFINLLRNDITKTIETIFSSIVKAFNTLLSESILRIIVIGYIANKIFNNEELFKRFKSIFSGIKEIQYKGLLIKNAQEATEKEIKDLKEKAESGDINAQIEINKKNLKKELVALMIDNDRIVKYLKMFIIDRYSSIKLPKNLIPNKVRLYELEKFFIYEVSVNSIILMGINPDLEELISETYHELVDKEIIHCAI